MARAKRTPAKEGELVELALDDLSLALRRARHSVCVATPFLSLPVARHLIRAADVGGAPRRRLITALNDGPVLAGYLDPDAIRAFVDAGFDVRSLRNIHAKVVLCDDVWGLVGSGNLTVAGSNGGNAELGIALGAGKAKEARRRFFEVWWRAAEPLDEAALAKLVATPGRPADPERRQRGGQGEIYRTSAGVELESSARSESDTGYWLKIMYGNDALSRAGGWRSVRWVSDAHVLKAGRPTRRPTYAVGDHRVMYLSRVERKACPAILRVTEEPVYDPERVGRESPGDEDRWSWLTSVELVAAVDLRRAPRLDDIQVGGRSVNQQGHIRLRPDQYRAALRAIRTR